MSEPIAVLLAEPDAPTRSGIRVVLEDAGFVICAEPVDSAAALDAALDCRPAICLVADRLAGGAVAALHDIYRRLPGCKLVLLTDSDDPVVLFAAVRAGACGCVRKDRDPRRLPDTLRGVLAGEAALSRVMTFVLLERWRTRERGRALATVPGASAITDRELDVLELMAEGSHTSEIAARLSISDVTVRRHAASVVAKLGVEGRAGAIRVLKQG
ncbi:MAG: LuxR C-terminal-related transcriptional regulator [Solirubrobacteraceae bacterium]